MRVQMLALRERNDVLCISLQRIARVLDDARFLEEGVGRQRREETRSARGRQNVARACHIVAERLRRVLAEEDRACVMQIRQQLARRGRYDLQMLGCDDIRHFAGVRELVEHDRAAVVRNALLDDVPARQQLRLSLHFTRDGLRLRHGVGQQDGRGQPVVLGLTDTTKSVQFLMLTNNEVLSFLTK